MNYQDEILCLLFHEPNLASSIEKDFFEGVQKNIFDLIKIFSERYGQVIREKDFLDFFKLYRERKVGKFSTEEARQIKKETKKIINLDIAKDYIRDKINTDVSNKLMLQAFSDKADLFREGKLQIDDIRDLLKTTQRCEKLFKRGDENERIEGNYIIRDSDKTSIEFPDSPILTCFDGFNRAKNYGGLFAPELIILAKPAKAYGTGILVHMAVEFMTAGYEVYYADVENGKKQILQRIRQTIIGCKADECYTVENELLYQERLASIRKRGGDIKVDSYIANKSTFADMAVNLRRYKEEDNFKPKICISDYIDRMASTGSKKEERHILSSLYFEAVELNKEFEFPMISISPITLTEKNKESFWITEQMLRDNKAKSYDAHWIIGINATEKEIDSGIIRFNTIVNRTGKKNTPLTAITIDYDRAIVKEFKRSKFWEYLEENEMIGKKKKKHKRLTKGEMILE